MTHILFDLNNCPSDLLDNEDFVRFSAWNAVKESKSELINLTCHKFKPQGITALAMLADSHLSIHTWPEKGVAYCDIFTCGEQCQPESAVEYLSKWLSSTNTKSKCYERI